MIPRFDARDFSGITPDMQAAYEKDGVLVLDKLIPAEECDRLRARMAELVDGFDLEEHQTVFSSTSQAHAAYDNFLQSAHGINFFLEEDAVDESGTVTKPKELAINKVGHALHDIDPTFNAFCRSAAFQKIATGLGQQSPLLLQSMYIFKQPHIGGEVVCHQDSTYLRTEPETCMGLWVAVEDATIENGCLWGIPGDHNAQSLRSAFRRNPETNETWTDTLDTAPFEEDKKVALEAPKGTVLVFGGRFPHLSMTNRSDKSRHAFTLHLIDKVAHYPADNWLWRPEDMPLRGF